MSRVDEFAELLSQGLGNAEIRGRMGLSKGAYQGLMMRLRRRLGKQAV